MQRHRKAVVVSSCWFVLFFLLFFLSSREPGEEGGREREDGPFPARFSDKNIESSGMSGKGFQKVKEIHSITNPIHYAFTAPSLPSALLIFYFVYKCAAKRKVQRETHHKMCSRKYEKYVSWLADIL